MKTATCVALMLTLFCGVASAELIVEYTTAGSTDTIAANSNTSATVAADDLVAGSGLNVLNFSTFNFSGWDTASTSFEDAVAANDFWTWGFDVTAVDTMIDLTTLNVRLDRSGTGPDDFEIRASVNGGTATSILIHDFMDDANAVNFLDVDLSGLGTVSTGDSVEFTLAAWNSESDAGTFDLETITFPGGTDSLQINGTISVIPEPTSAVVLALTGLAFFRRRR